MGYKDPDKQREYQRKWIAKRRAEYFDGKCCVRCGGCDDLELDHIDPRRKVSHNIWSWSAPRREAEIDKCQVLCRLCHQDKSVEQLPITRGFVAYTHGTDSMYNRHDCRCEPCRAWKRVHNAATRAKAKARAA